MITKKCYFYNVGTTFDKDNLTYIEDVWNSNGNCCKADLCNGLNCEGYGIEFNKDDVLNRIKDYVKNGVINTYGYIKSVNITLPEEEWNDIYKYLLDNYNFNSIDDASERGFISFNYCDLIEDYSSYWEEPDESYLKTGLHTIEENKIHILKENKLNSKTIKWINENLYGSRKELDAIEI